MENIKTSNNNAEIRHLQHVDSLRGIAVLMVLGIHVCLAVGGSWVILERYNFMNIFANITFINGFYPSANNNIVPGGWSIGTEVAFYICFPVLFVLLKKIKIISVTKFVIVLTLSLMASQAILLIIFLFTGKMVSNNNFLYFNLATQIPVFCSGIIFYLYENKEVKHKIIFDLTGFIIMTSLALTLWIFVPTWSFSLIPFISGISFLFLFRIFRDNQYLNQKLIMRIGQVSYSMYLIHFIFTKILKIITPKIASFIGPDLTVIFFFFVVTTATFLLALLSEKVIEKPFINLGKKIIKRMQNCDIEYSESSRVI